MQNPEILLLKYEWQDNTLVRGRLTVGEQATSFSSFTYPQMLMLVATEVRDKGSITSVVLHRTDQPELEPIRLPDYLVELFRQDPPEAFRAMTFTPPPVQETRPLLTIPVLQAGYDTIVNTFGDEVFIRMQETQVECPGCGFWGPLDTPYHCSKVCGIRLPRLIAHSESWVSVEVQELLKTDGCKGRFYLPREWNQDGNWITKERLIQLHQDWLREKAQVS